MSSLRARITFQGEDLGIFDPDDFTMEHAMLLEDRTGLTLVDVAEGLAKLSGRAIQALVWIQKVRLGQTNAELHANFTVRDVKAERLVETVEDPTEAAPAAETPSATSETSTSDS